MTNQEVLALTLIIVAVSANAYSFFRDPKKRNEEIYNRTAKDTSFNRLPRKKKQEMEPNFFQPAVNNLCLALMLCFILPIFAVGIDVLLNNFFGKISTIIKQKF